MADSQQAAASGTADLGHEGLAEQRVTWAELFFDLVWVFGLTQVAATLAASNGIGEAARTLVVLRSASPPAVRPRRRGLAAGMFQLGDGAAVVAAGNGLEWRAGQPACLLPLSAPARRSST